MSTRLAHSKRRALDAYYTPDKLAELLVSLLPIGPDDLELFDPHVGGGAFVRAFIRATGIGYGMDIDPAAPGRTDCTVFKQGDFLTDTTLEAGAPATALGARWDHLRDGIEWIVGNPPYSTAQDHVERALEVSERHVAFLLRLGFLESAKRLPFWAKHPCRKVWVLSSRPSFTGNGRHDSCAYGFFWWDKDHTGPTELEVLDTRGV